MKKLTWPQIPAPYARAIMAVVWLAGAGLSAAPVATVVLAESASLPEQTAARELQAYLSKASSSDVLLVLESPENVAGAVSPRLFVGPTRFAREHGLDPDSLGDEEWVIRSVESDLILIGGRPRGTLYAVYHFLEDGLGVHWWNPWEETVPQVNALPVNGWDRRGRPKFRYRDIYMTYGGDRGRFAARSRLNRNGDHTIAAEYGGCRDYGPPYHVHTFYRYVPPAKYFKTHPEYFSLIKGKRTADRAQLCLTNPNVRALVIRKLEQYIRESRKAAAARGLPPPQVFDISQNDWGGACQCEACRKIAEAEGSEAGPLLDFLNAVADAIKEKYPDVMIDTLAYQYTQKPPKNIRPRDNIIIRLCDTRSNFTRPITDRQNSPFRETLVSWSKIAPHLRVWDYAVTYAHPVGLPFPSLHTYAPDFRFYAEHNVEGVFTEFEFPVVADMRDLKVWVMAKLLENPYADPEALVRTFTDGFYGPAATNIRAYLAALRKACSEKGSYVSMGTSISGMGYLDWPFLRAAHRLFDQAEVAVHRNPVLLRRVRHARLPVDRATLAVWRRMVQGWQREGHTPTSFPLDRSVVAERCRKTWHEQIDIRFPPSRRPKEKEKADAEIAQWTALPAYVALPARFRNLPADRVYDFTADVFRNWKNIVQVVKDPEAESGITARLEFPTRIDTDRHPLEKYKLPMPWGLYQPSTKKFIAGRRIRPEDVPGPGYHWYRFGSAAIHPTEYLYFFWSWIIQVDLDSVIDPGAPDATYTIWARIKFEGPAFPHGDPNKPNAICVERVVLVRD